MASRKSDLQQIFEYEIKRKLTERARNPADELRILINGFKFYDFDYTGKLDKNNWVKGILRTGLSGFSETDLFSLFDSYDVNKSGLIDYKNYSNYIYGREELKPLPNPKSNNNQSQQDVNNNLNTNAKTPINNSTNTNVKTPNNQMNQQQIENQYQNNKNQIIQETNQNQNNVNNINNNQINENNMNQQQMQNPQNIDPNAAKEYLKSLIVALKEQININNGVKLFQLLGQFISSQNKELCVEEFLKICQNIGINIPIEDLSNLFGLLDYSGTGKVAIDEILNIILDPLTEHRKLVIVSKFAKIDVNKLGEIPINYLKSFYNAKNHPDVISGKYSEEDIFNHFCQTLDVYCQFRNIKENISFEQFIEYYSIIASSMPNDADFEILLNSVWDNTNDNNVNENNMNLNNNINNQVNYNQVNNNQVNMNINNNQNNNNNNSNNNSRYNNNDARYNNNNNGRSCNDIGINGLLIGESRQNEMPRNYGLNNLKNQQYNNQNNNYNNNNMNNQNNNLNQNNQNCYNNNIKSPTPIRSQTIETSASCSNMMPRRTPIYGKARVNKPKLIYNPITNEYVTGNNNNQDNYNNINFNGNQNNYNNINTNSNQNNYNNINTNLPQNQNQQQGNPNEILANLAKILMLRGCRSLLSFQRKISLYDKNHNGLISLENFYNVILTYNINLSLEEIQILFNAFDKENTGFMSYDKLIKLLLGDVNSNRENIVKNIYNNFNKNGQGKVSVNDIKNGFNSKKHPDVITKRKSESEVFGEFLDNLETFKEYLENLKGVSCDYFEYNDFLYFCCLLGFNLDDDNLFEFLINSCWGTRGLSRGTGFVNNNGYGDNLRVRTANQIINNRY